MLQVAGNCEFPWKSYKQYLTCCGRPQFHYNQADELTTNLKQINSDELLQKQASNLAEILGHSFRQ